MTHHSQQASALPKAELFASLHSLIATYPTTPDLRTALLDHLHDLLQQTLPTDPVAVKLYATRNLLPELEGTALVDALKAANEQLSSAVNSACTSARSETAHGMALAYAGFIEEWVQKDELDTALVGCYALHMASATDSVDRERTS